MFVLSAVDHLIPRIRECIEGAPVPQRSDTPTGRELLKLYAADYFNKLSDVSLYAYFLPYQPFIQTLNPKGFRVYEWKGSES